MTTLIGLNGQPIPRPGEAAHPDHDCDEEAVPYESDGALGHGWECGICGRFLQAG